MPGSGQLHCAPQDFHSSVASGFGSLGTTAKGAWTAITKPISTAFDNIVGSTTSMISKTAGKLGVKVFTSTVKQGASKVAQAVAKKAVTQSIFTTMEQALMRKTAEWTLKVFGKGVTDALFTAGGNSAVVTGTGAATTQIGSGAMGFTTGFATVLTGVMIAYAVYQIAVILVSLIFKCTKKQFRFLSDIKLRTCHVVGTGCGSSVCLVPSPFGGCALSKCVRWDTKGCCFNSPLSRIIQEQVRPQLGMSWIASSGTDSNGYYYFNTSCGGITTKQLQKVDWSKVDLSEWVAILQVSGNWPTHGSLSVNSLTGTGSALNVGGQSSIIGTRLNAKQRIQNRLGNQNINKLRQNLGKGLWNQIP